MKMENIYCNMRVAGTTSVNTNAKLFDALSKLVRHRHSKFGDYLFQAVNMSPLHNRLIHRHNTTSRSVKTSNVSRIGCRGAEDRATCAERLLSTRKAPLKNSTSHCGRILV